MSSQAAATGNTYTVFREYFTQSPLSFQEEGDKFYLTSQFHTAKLIPKDILKRDYKTAFNKEIRCFHISPETDVRSFVGVVDSLWWDDVADVPMVKIEVFDDTPTARSMRAIIREDFEKPLEERRIKGISAGLLETRDKTTDRIVKFHAREVSLARDPACEECTIQKISTFESDKMPDKETDDSTVLALFEGVEKKFQETVDSQAELIEELHAKIERYEKTIMLQKDKIGQLEGDLQKDVTTIANFEREVVGERKKAELAAKEPMVGRIMSYEKLDTKTEEGKKRFDELMEENVRALDKMIRGYERVKGLGERGFGDQTQALFSPGAVNPDDLPIIRGYENNPEEYQKAVDRAVTASAKHTRTPGDLQGPIQGGY